jgi:hypothetical protein
VGEEKKELGEKFENRLLYILKHHIIFCNYVVACNYYFKFINVERKGTCVREYTPQT